LIHGTSADHTRWRTVTPALEERFTVYAVDRRGRGASGDSNRYAIEREFEDVASVVDSIDGPVNLLGHSYGALCSLEASLLTSKIRKLILYEPPIPVGLEIYPPAIVGKLQALLDASDREGVVTTFMGEIAQVRPNDLRLLQSLPAWKARVASAHTISRELQADRDYTFDARRFSGLKTPTLLLIGGDSPWFLKAGNEALQRVLPDCRTIVMPGQQHAAMDTGTELFVSEVLRFLEAG